MIKVEKKQTELLRGGQNVSREEYCATLRDIFDGGGHQGDISWLVEVFNLHCRNSDPILLMDDTLP